MDLKKYLQEKRAVVDEALETFLPEAEGPAADVIKAMRYSLFAGGKRLRPILCMAGADAVGGEERAVLPVACALELIHTYSLIHDDLPVMDDDDLRRGKPTSHKVFGEAVALLAGDGLPSYTVLHPPVGLRHLSTFSQPLTFRNLLYQIKAVILFIPSDLGIELITSSTSNRE